MLNRRDVLRLIPASSLFWLGAPRSGQAAPAPARPVLAGPPVVQHPRTDGFAVSFALGRLATGWVEWGLAPDRLDQRAVASRAGLVAASDRAMIVPVCLGGSGKPGEPIYYRAVAQALRYESAYKLQREEPVASPVYRLTVPPPAAAGIRIAVINDTHEQAESLKAVASRIEAIAPDALVWNGDTPASAFDGPADPPRVLLAQAWAATRPLIFVPGNHDVRGASARDVGNCLAAGPEAGLPYNVAWRCGPVALLTLDTGEDKPDRHPVFAGTAAYEPYRARQAAWLREALARPEIASAPFKVACCHIPLRGLPEQNDGLDLNDFARWSGDGAQRWMPALCQSGVQLVVSGHTHAWRIDDPSEGRPMQVVGGGCDPRRGETVTVVVLEADADGLRVVVQDAFSGKELARRKLNRPA
jgi:predicted phosphodiesterase